MYPEGDLNPHAFRHTPLKRTCLPIPPLPPIRECKFSEFIFFAKKLFKNISTLQVFGIFAAKFKPKFIKTMRKNLFMIALFGSLWLGSCTDGKQNNTEKKEKADAKKEVSNSAPESIVYVNSDSLITGYEFYKKSVKEIEVKKNQFAGDIENQASAFQNKVLKAQQNAQAMTIGELEATKKNLAAEEQRLMQYRDALMQNIANQEKEAVEKMNKNIDDFVKRYAEKNGYRMILGYKQGVTAWYVDPKLDVTQDVLKGLNEEYRNQGENKETKKDSTKK